MLTHPSNDSQPSPDRVAACAGKSVRVMMIGSIALIGTHRGVSRAGTKKTSGTHSYEEHRSFRNNSLRQQGLDALSYGLSEGVKPP